ncbi:MAG: hypothetical protein HC902_00125 [Calothrix sp. SM1_5_4]|nr:hypothetical protein [Calothrix sp. SM1_5_4]
MDLRSGCKYQGEKGCNWGIVNYRCNPAKVENVRQENLARAQSATKRVRFLYSAMSQAFDGGSRAAANDAFARYLSYTRQIVNAPDAPTRLLGLEASSALLLFVNMNQGTLNRLSPENVTQFFKFTDELEAVENSTPRDLSSFPTGALAK